MTSSLPFLPYGRQAIDETDVAAVVEALRSDLLTTGPRVEAFERALAERLGVRHVIAVSNGTAALHAAYHAVGVGSGDTVVVPAITFLATANAARFLDAEARFADVGADDGLLAADLLERALADGGPVRAVAPVHLTGRPVDLDGVAAVARAHGAAVIEDACHALGATYRGAPIGACSRSDAAVLSFHPVKHVTTGEGGAIATNDDTIARRARRFRSHGMVHDAASLESPSPGPWYYEQQELGYNYRITDLQCALGSSQLRRLDDFLARRRALAARYDTLLAEVPHVRPIARGPEGAESAWHLYAVLIDFAAVGRTRGEVMLALRERGIGSQVHYIPVPAQPYYRRRGADPARFPGALRYYERTLSLPLFPALRDDDPDRVVAALAAVLAEGADHSR
ncbi:MAG: UDP-4-amino-4,6-dideoxy-N-acetyl-beta-L-altrosamine transaminase [Polyangiaceae bacterium]|nr:UDP-4-amino-4,6-dideoxy-N-acetyl-beta-L-altrosamine transaminase [Polyangiaceae bacterium]